MPTIQQTIRWKSQQTKEVVTCCSRSLVGLMAHKGVEDFKRIRKAGEDFKKSKVRF